MKKLFILFVMCIVGMVMPQALKATAVVTTSGTTVTIKTDKAGDLQQYLQSASDAEIAEIRSASTIVFDGKFNKADLEALNGAGCCTQTTVDMSEAKFVKPAGPGENTKTYLYHDINARNNDNQDKHPGDLCIVGATKYKSARSNNWTLVEIEQSQGQNFQPRNILADDYNTITDIGDGTYLMLPTSLNYYQLKVTTDELGNETSRTWEQITIPTDEQRANAKVVQSQYTTSDLESLKTSGGYNNGDIIQIRTTDCTFRYFKGEAPFIWQSVAGTGDDYQNGAQNTDQWYANIDEAPSPTDYGQYILAGGTEYLFKGPAEGWIDASQSGDEDLDFNDMSFEYWGSNVTKAITSKYVDPNKPLPAKLCKNCTNLKDLTIYSGTIHKIYEGNNMPPLEKVTIGNRVAQIGNGEANGGFAKISTIKQVVFEAGGTVPLTFKENCFLQCSQLTEIHIPARATLIEIQAFGSTGLQKVYFESPNEGTTAAPLVIKNQAFANNTNMTDVFVDVSPSSKLLICEYNAFSYESMVAQTAVDGPSAILHFKEDDFNFYAGEWKKGMVFTQSNLNAYKDGYSGTVGNHTYVPAPTQNASEINGGYAQIDNNSDGFYHPQNAGENTFYAPGNGWQQFAKTGSEREIYVTGDVYMTYSTAKPYSLPTGIYAFRVINYIPEKVNGVDQKGTMILKMIQEVPVHTGMLLISTDQYVVKNGTDKAKFYFGDPVETPVQYPHEESNSDKLNYLVPAVSKVKVAPVSKGPENGNIFELKGTSDFDHRNFIMRKDTHQFVRTKEGTMADNRAFLSLPIEMFNNDNESELEGPSPLYTMAGKGLANYEEVPSTTSGAKPSMIFDYDVELCGMIWPLIPEEEFKGIATGISTMNKETVKEGIYTLQGLKVSAPSTKGIYIVNGKKIIIK